MTLYYKFREISMLKKIFFSLSAFFLVLTYLFPGLRTAAYEPTGVDISASAAMLLSLDTDEVLYGLNTDKKVYPASITKIMTATVMLESPSFNPEGHVAMTEEVQSLISGTGSAVSNLQVGEEITELDLLYFVLMSSYGDCAILAAIHYGGSVDNFLSMMNAKAEELELTGTHYSNPVGLHDEGTYTTVHDI